MKSLKIATITLLLASVPTASFAAADSAGMPRVSAATATMAEAAMSAPSYPTYRTPSYPTQADAVTMGQDVGTQYDPRYDARVQENRRVADSAGYRCDDGRRGKTAALLGGIGGAIIGGAVGAVAGNLIAGAGNRLAGSLIGGGVGGLAGAAIDASIKRKNDRRNGCDDGGRNYGNRDGGYRDDGYRDGGRGETVYRDGGYRGDDGYRGETVYRDRGYDDGYTYGYGPPRRIVTTNYVDAVPVTHTSTRTYVTTQVSYVAAAVTKRVWHPAPRKRVWRPRVQCITGS